MFMKNKQSSKKSLTEFKPVSPNVDFPKLEKELIEYWKKNKIFEKSVEARPKDKRWTFLDGPPFVTGMPHYGTLLSSLPKDLFGRYWTMKGYRVERVWGWDGHGLPIENKVETALGIKSKREIEEKIGVKKFIDECKKYVNDVSAEWEWYVDHIGRWVDFKNAYRTWDLDYMESVMWVFKQMYEAGFIYKGFRVTLYCPHCATPISNFETALDNSYKEIKDDATTYKYKLEGEDDTFILAWSTTPWNKIVTPALAVNPELIYVKVRKDGESYIIAKPTIARVIDMPYETIEELRGEKLVGRKFEPHYDYYRIEPGEKAFEIIAGDFVTADEGTGVVTIAAYGEEDLAAMKEENIHIEMHLDEEGNIKPDVPKFGGMYYLKANRAVNEDLASRGLIYKDEEVLHNVPICWRCATRLYYAPIDAWFVNIQKLKSLMKKTNEEVNWFPAHFKYGRFLKSLEAAPDWNISRNRYWGSPVPVWECECSERFVPGSIAELEEASDSKISDLHKPGIDEVQITCKKCGRKAKRTPEVLDSWIEAGSASFAERHFPFDNPPAGGQKLEDFFPPDFIEEYTGQIRAWFYVLHAIGAALYKSPAFKNVAVTGVILGTDGRKMSKNYGNYPDPAKLLETYGGDALRLYLMGSPVMRGEDILISEENYRQQVRGTLLILWNVYNFFVSYANIDGWESRSVNHESSSNVLDRWIVSLTHRLIREVTEALDKYDTVTAVTKVQEFVTSLSTWYIRRSRDRVGPAAEDEEDKNAFYATAYQVLISLTKIAAPIIPFVSEEIYRNLTAVESVHLADWPQFEEKTIDEKVEREMKSAMEIASLVHMVRKTNNIPVRIPLKVMSYEGPSELSEEISKIVRDETNVEELKFGGKADNYKVDGDVGSKNQNLAAGEAREIVRKIQGERKNLGTALDEKVDVEIESWPSSFESEIKRKALVRNLTKAVEFKVKRLNA